MAEWGGRLALALARLAEEEASRYRAMASRRAAAPYRAGLLEVAADVLDVVAGELVERGFVTQSTLNWLADVETALKRSMLPSTGVARVRRLLAKYARPAGPTPSYGVPHVDVSNTILS